jgi:DNA-binding response OmpR family regulator
MGKQILLVDDDAEFRAAIATILEGAGHTVAQAADGTSALAALKTHTCDLLITDVVMPDRDGLDLIRSLPAEGRPKVLAISGGSTMLPAAYTLRASGALGADATLNKPFRASELLAQVEALLGR